MRALETRSAPGSGGRLIAAIRPRGKGLRFKSDENPRNNGARSGMGGCMIIQTNQFRDDLAHVAGSAEDVALPLRTGSVKEHIIEVGQVRFAAEFLRKRAAAIDQPARGLF